MIKPGKKMEAWFKARSKLILDYWEAGILKCEWCESDWGLNFHHLDKRSSGKAKHTLRGTRLLCPECHEKAEYNRTFNDKLGKLR